MLIHFRVVRMEINFILYFSFQHKLSEGPLSTLFCILNKFIFLSYVAGNEFTAGNFFLVRFCGAKC